MAEFKNFLYEIEEDKQLVERAIDYNLWLLCGENFELREKMKEILIDKCMMINILENGSKHPIINENCPGHCSSNDEQNFIVEMYGLKNCDYKLQALRVAIHEFCHAMQHVASFALSDRKLSYVCDGFLYSSRGGIIQKEKLNSSKIYEKYDLYGEFFCERITEIFESIPLFYFDLDEIFITKGRILKEKSESLGELDKIFIPKSITADHILKLSSKVFGDLAFNPNINDIYLSITKLALAAFSNVGNISYDRIIKNGDSIVLSRINGKPVNDLLYGIMCDSRYLEEQYDKYMGKNAYYNLCKILDQAKINRLNYVTVQKVMSLLAIFHDRKKHFLLSNKIITEEEYLDMTNDFEVIFDDLQSMCDIYYIKNNSQSFTKKKKMNYKSFLKNK